MQGGCRCGETVGNVVSSDERREDVDAAGAGGDPEVSPVVALFENRAGDVRSTVDGKGANLCVGTGVFREGGTAGIVRVEDQRAAPLEQLDDLRLGGPVGGEVAVIVEVVASDVGDDGTVEEGAGDTALVEGMTGEFDGGEPGAVADHRSQPVRERARVGSGEC